MEETVGQLNINYPIEDTNPEIRNIKNDLTKAYNFWVNEYLPYQEIDLSKFTKAEKNRHLDQEEVLEGKATEMLILVVKHRKCLWNL